MYCVLVPVPRPDKFSQNNGQSVDGSGCTADAVQICVIWMRSGNRKRYAADEDGSEEIVHSWLNWGWNTSTIGGNCPFYSILTAIIDYLSLTILSFPVTLRNQSPFSAKLRWLWLILGQFEMGHKCLLVAQQLDGIISSSKKASPNHTQTSSKQTFYSLLVMLLLAGLVSVFWCDQLNWSAESDVCSHIVSSSQWKDLFFFLRVGQTGFKRMEN